MKPHAQAGRVTYLATLPLVQPVAYCRQQCLRTAPDQRVPLRQVLQSVGPPQRVHLQKRGLRRVLLILPLALRGGLLICTLVLVKVLLILILALAMPLVV